MPLKLIEAAMELYHVPEKAQGIVRSYIKGMKIRFTVDDHTTYHLPHPVCYGYGDKSYR